MKRLFTIIATLAVSAVALFVADAAVDMVAARKAYIEKYSALAISEMERSGVPASITLAQGLLESGAGRSTLATQAHNHFGIKCGKAWRGSKTYHDDDARREHYSATLKSRDGSPDPF